MRGLVARAFAAIARFVMHGFFRRTQIVGTDRLPRGRPLLVVANHFNGFVDPIVLAAALPRAPRFVAKATLGRFPPARLLLRLFGVVLVARQQDRPAGVDNRGAFAECHKALRRGAAIAIFPEGTTHDLAGLVDLKTGAARIALGAREAGAKGVLIVPVGMTFPDKVALRSSVLVRVGEPIDLDGDVPEASELDQEAVRALTAEIETRLRVVSPDFADVEEWWALDAAAEIALRTADDRDPPLLERALVANRLGRAPEEAKVAVRRRLADYVLALSLARLRDRDVVATGSPAGLLRSAVRTALVVGLLGPLVLAGSALTVVPALLVAGTGLLVRTPVTKGTVRVLCALLAFPLTWGIAAAQLADGWAALGLVLLWAAAGLAAVVVGERAVGLVFQVFAWRAARERISYLDALHAHRTALVAEVRAVAG